METALKTLLEHTFGDYVSGLDRQDVSKFPLTLRNLTLKEKRIQEDLDEDASFPFDVTSGTIGSVSVTPGWLGTVDVVATNITVKLSFSPMKAMRVAMKPDEEETWDDHVAKQRGPPFAGPGGQVFRPPPPPAPPVAPRYCKLHATSDSRTKVEPRMRDCKRCKLEIQTNYADFEFCPPCSEAERRCMLCGADAPSAGTYVPAASLAAAAAVERANERGPPGGPPGHDTDRNGPHRRISAPFGPPPWDRDRSQGGISRERTAVSSWPADHLSPWPEDGQQSHRGGPPPPPPPPPLKAESTARSWDPPVGAGRADLPPPPPARGYSGQSNRLSVGSAGGRPWPRPAASGQLMPVQPGGSERAPGLRQWEDPLRNDGAAPPWRPPPPQRGPAIVGGVGGQRNMPGDDGGLLGLLGLSHLDPANWAFCINNNTAWGSEEEDSIKSRQDQRSAVQRPPQTTNRR